MNKENDNTGGAEPSTQNKASAQNKASGQNKESGESAPVDAADASRDVPETPPTGAPEPVPATTEPPVIAAAPPRGGRGLAFLALIVALVGVAAAGWLFLKMEAQQSEYAERESRLIRQVADIDNVVDSARRSIGDAVEASQQATLAVSERLAEERKRVEAQLAEAKSSVDAVQAALLRQRQQLIELRSTDRVDWSLAEAEYLLRLAYQRLLTAKDVVSATALLASADAILYELDDTDLLPARTAIAQDMAALRAIPEVDVEGSWLRLQALAGRIDKLILFELPGEAAEPAAVDPDAGWQDRLSQGISAALEKVRSYLVIRRRDEPYAVLLDPQWEQLVRQNLRMQLAQAQAALLSGNAVLYDASLEATRRWLGEFFDFNETEVQALNAELDALQAVRISQDYPDIGGSLSALKAVIDTRHEVD